MIRRLLIATRGVAAVEFAFIAPAFLFITTSAIDLGYIQWARSQLSGASQAAGRAIIQSKNADGTTRTTDDRRTIFLNRVNAAMSSFAKPQGQSTVIAIRKYSKFSKMISEPFVDGSHDPSANGVENITPEEKNGAYDTGEQHTELNGEPGRQAEVGIDNELGGVGEVIKIDVEYPMQAVFSYNQALFGKNGTITVRSTTVFRNEPD